MALARGRFGIEYNPRQIEREPSGLGWLLAAVAVAAFVSLTWTLVKRVRSHKEEARLLKTEQTVVEQEAPETEKTVSRQMASQTVFQTFQPLNSDLVHRPARVRNLLMRLDEAEKRKDIEMAVSTIETIRALPGSPAADIDDSLARRLGALNIRRLFDLRCAQWVKTVTVGRGDSASRLASENGSTLASFARLNGGDVSRIVRGRKMYVMDHPRFNLVLHKRTRTADLLLNGKFFRRYDLTDAVKAREGAYEMPEKRRLFWSGMGTAFNAGDRAELDMLLPRGTPILVSEM